MITHSYIRRRLYEYIRGELPPEEQDVIERHLLTCKRCRIAHEQMTLTIQVLSGDTSLPSEERSVEFWNTFATRVEEQIQRTRGAVVQKETPISDAFQWILGMRWRTALSIVGGFAAIAAAFFLWQGHPATPDNRQTEVAMPVPSALERVDERMAQYLRKSQTLLVGLTNKRAAAGRPVDIDAEREASRALVNEARLFRHEPLDPRSARLVGDLERIFIEVANTEPSRRTADIDMIRSGIRQENLLFKVRMAQARFEPAQGK